MLTEILWCVHVRGPDDLVPVATYEDAVLLSDSINWWWQSLDLRGDNEPIISAIPALYEGASDHAEWVAKLRTKACDYRMPLPEDVERLRMKAFYTRVEKDAKLRSFVSEQSA